MASQVTEKKKIQKVIKAFQLDMGGFPVKQALPAEDIRMHDPFLLIHHAKQIFNQDKKAIHQGVGPHPHRGFSPVTFVVSGELHHRDSRGNNQIAKKGEVQWMSAGFGIIHSERPSQYIVDQEIEQEIIQLWINTPSAAKMQVPRYQFLTRENIPQIISTDKLIRSGVIAGEWKGIRQKQVETESDLLILWSFGEKTGKENYLIPNEHNSMLYLIKGSIEANGVRAQSNELIIMDRQGSQIEVKCLEDSQYLLLSGKAINERVLQHGPFVMNNKSEILEAMRDYQMGKMGFLVEE